MAKYLVITNSYQLLRITADRIAYIASDGSYSTLKLIGGEEHTFSFNLSVFERLIEQQLQEDASMFIRIGRGLIINSRYIYAINLSKQELILSDLAFPDKFILQVAKEALKSLKSVIENSVHNKM